ncbi:MAG: metabolite traffic protein EboE [Mariniblastus sp.]
MSKNEIQIGYCGNVHPGRTIDEVKKNLVEYSLEVKKLVRPDTSMGIGLWLSATAAKELDDNQTLLEFRDWLAENGLLPFTLNGFPYGDFHQTVVKHDVYRPTWADTERLDYTIRLAEILNVLLPEGIDGTISTLPLGWPVEVNDGNRSNVNDELFWKSCARNLIACAERLSDIQQNSGRNITICIEPEPGCILDTWDDIVGFFDQHLFAIDEPTTEMVRNHIGVCHDVCHSAVMFEEQSKAVDEYARAGIKIGKVQVSSAVDVDFENDSAEAKTAKLEQLSSFAEPKYLHQTSVRNGESVEFYEDLQLALDAAGKAPTGQWRVHFHVPIFSTSLDLIGTTQSDIVSCVEAIRESGKPTPHFEVETYAWNVLPASLRDDSLANGIAKELEWFDEQVKTSP